MRLIIQPDYQSVSKWAAHYVAAKIKAAHPDVYKRQDIGIAFITQSQFGYRAARVGKV